MARLVATISILLPDTVVLLVGSPKAPCAGLSILVVYVESDLDILKTIGRLWPITSSFPLQLPSMFCELMVAIIDIAKQNVISLFIVF